MKYQGKGKYTVTFKNQKIEDVTISDIRNFFDSLDKIFAQELYYRFKRKYSIGEFSLEDIDAYLNEKIIFEGNLSTDFVQEIYKYMNKNNKISKKKAAVIIAEKFGKSIKTIEKHLYKKN